MISCQGNLTTEDKGLATPARRNLTNLPTGDRDTGKIQHAVSQSHLIEPLEAAKEPDYGKAQSKRQWRNPC